MGTAPNYDLKAVPDIPMLFIVGKGRSGTTLLQTLLDAHPNIILPLESRFVIHLKSKYEKVRYWDEKQLLSFYNDLFTDLKFSTLWTVDKEKLKTELLALKGQTDFSTICKVVYLNFESLFPKNEIRFIGDKNPIYTVFTKDLLRIFPRSKFIHLVRDHRDNIHSHMSVFPIKNVPYLAKKWVYYNSTIEELKLALPSDVLTIKYEDLAAEPARQLRIICSFLGLTYHDEMLDFHKQTSTSMGHLEPYVSKFHSNIFNPVNTNKVSCWKTKMLPEHVRVADVIAGNMALLYGYPVKTDSRSSDSFINAWNNLKLYLWLGFVRVYYKAPLSLRHLVSELFKIVFGKDYKTQKVLFTKKSS